MEDLGTIAVRMRLYVAGPSVVLFWTLCRQTKMFLASVIGGMAKQYTLQYKSFRRADGRRLISPPAFLGTKLEAFHGRGAGDFLASHDLEDIITVVDGRPELSKEVRATSPQLREYLVAQVRALLQNENFVEALPAHLPGDIASQARVPELLNRLRLLTQ